MQGENDADTLLGELLAYTITKRMIVILVLVLQVPQPSQYGEAYSLFITRSHVSVKVITSSRRI